MCPKVWLRMNRNRSCIVCFYSCTFRFHARLKVIKGTLLPVLWYWNICRVTFSTGDVRSLILVICRFRFLCKILKYIVIRQEHFSSHSITKFNNIQANFIRKHVTHLFYFTLLPRVMVNHCSRPLSSWLHSSWPVRKQSSLSHCFLDVAYLANVLVGKH